MRSTTYEQPFGDESYPVEPSDADCVVLARALAHFVGIYYDEESDISAQAIALDLFDSHSLKSLSSDERRRIAAVFPNIEVDVS